MQILKEKIVRYETDGSIVKGYDAGELIRCKDCKHYEETDAKIGTCLLTMCGAYPEGYCAWAEREEE